MSTNLLAKRYAKGLLEAGKEENVLEEIYNGIKLIAEKLTSDVINFLSAPPVPLNEKFEIINTFAQNLNLHKFLTRTLLILAEKGRAKLIPQICSSFVEYYMEEKGYIPVEVKVARELKEEEINLIRKGMEEFTKKNVFLNISIDPEIIGGVIIKIGDMVIDNSILRRLEDIKFSLL